MIDVNEVRNVVEGSSDYNKHKYQPWDFWIKFKINNGFDCDLIKRILRSKATDPRILDYKKIKHICLERIRQFNENENVFSIENLEPKDITLSEMLEDYDITKEDVLMITRILYPKSNNRVEDYECVIELCDKRIKELE